LDGLAGVGLMDWQVWVGWIGVGWMDWCGMDGLVWIKWIGLGQMDWLVVWVGWIGVGWIGWCGPDGFIRGCKLSNYNYCSRVVSRRQSNNFVSERRIV
jgi:hypothetical protein